jgi:hypothetical protein
MTPAHEQHELARLWLLEVVDETPCDLDRLVQAFAEYETAWKAWSAELPPAVRATGPCVAPFPCPFPGTPLEGFPGYFACTLHRLHAPASFLREWAYERGAPRPAKKAPSPSLRRRHTLRRARRA